MHNPLVIEAISVDRGHYRWRLEPARGLPLHADSRPILFLLCSVPRHWQRIVPAAGYLSPAAVDRSGRDGRCANIRPVAAAGGAVETSQLGCRHHSKIFVQRRAEKVEGQGRATAVNADPPPAPWLIYIAPLHINDRTGVRGRW